jgi:hypothetical protein
LCFHLNQSQRSRKLGMQVPHGSLRVQRS